MASFCRLAHGTDKEVEHAKALLQQTEAKTTMVHIGSTAVELCSRWDATLPSSGCDEVDRRRQLRRKSGEQFRRCLQQP